MKRVRFSLAAPGAKKVLLVGDFTDWQSKARKMQRLKPRSRTFVATVALPPGRYEYKFIVDGEWIEDPQADAVLNRFGTRNSVCTVGG